MAQCFVFPNAFTLVAALHGHRSRKAIRYAITPNPGGLLNIVFCRVDKTGSKGELDCLMHVVDSEFAEYVFPVGVDSMETRKALLRYFLCSHAQGDVFEYLQFSLSEIWQCFFSLVLFF